MRVTTAFTNKVLWFRVDAVLFTFSVKNTKYIWAPNIPYF